MRPIHGCPKNFWRPRRLRFGGSLADIARSTNLLTYLLTYYYSQHFSWAFVPIDPVNVPTKFDVRSFTRSWDNRGYPHTVALLFSPFPFPLLLPFSSLILYPTPPPLAIYSSPTGTPSLLPYPFPSPLLFLLSPPSLSRFPCDSTALVKLLSDKQIDTEAGCYCRKWTRAWRVWRRE